MPSETSRLRRVNPASAFFTRTQSSQRHRDGKQVGFPGAGGQSGKMTEFQRWMVVTIAQQCEGTQGHQLPLQMTGRVHVLCVSHNLERKPAWGLHGHRAGQAHPRQPVCGRPAPPTGPASVPLPAGRQAGGGLARALAPRGGSILLGLTNVTWCLAF